MLLPPKIGHHYTPIEVLDVSLLQSIYSTHRRLRVFAQKGLKCTYCEKVGIYLIKCEFRGAIHVDVYTEEFELMTVDHIWPKSKGGSDKIENLTPACNRCNTEKGSNTTELII